VFQRSPGEKPFQTVFLSAIPPATALKRGVNERFLQSKLEVCATALGELGARVKLRPSFGYLLLKIRLVNICAL
jgi:hypothetical protein